MIPGVSAEGARSTGERVVFARSPWQQRRQPERIRVLDDLPVLTVFFETLVGKFTRTKARFFKRNCDEVRFRKNGPGKRSVSCRFNSGFNRVQEFSSGLDCCVLSYQAHVVASKIDLYSVLENLHLPCGSMFSLIKCHSKSSVISLGRNENGTLVEEELSKRP